MFNVQIRKLSHGIINGISIFVRHSTFPQKVEVLGGQDMVLATQLRDKVLVGDFLRFSEIGPRSTNERVETGIMAQ